MKRPKTVGELRREIQLSEKLKTQSQEEIGRALSIHQATLSRILRGQFKRRSSAVDKVCQYAQILRMTDLPMSQLEASLDQLSQLATSGSPNGRCALKLIRLAAELLESDPSTQARTGT